MALLVTKWIVCLADDIGRRGNSRPDRSDFVAVAAVVPQQVHGDEEHDEADHGDRHGRRVVQEVVVGVADEEAGDVSSPSPR